MLDKSDHIRGLLLLFLLMQAVAALQGQAPSSGGTGQSLLERALATELRDAQATSHPMRYHLRRSSPRLTTTKDIIETKEGAVARLVAINDGPLGPPDQQKEHARLDGLLSDPGRQRHRKQNEDVDMGRVLKVLRALPKAFLYQYAGTIAVDSGTVQKFTFRPNPAFNPPDLETQVLTVMSGEIWVDVSHERVIRLEGHLQQDVDFGWGILGRLNKGGWVLIDQADIGGGQWRIVRFKMIMTGRVLFRSKSFDTAEERTQFVPMPVDLGYQQAIQMLRAASENPGPGSR